VQQEVSDEDLTNLFGRRQECYNQCNKAYFPSLVCEYIQDVRIDLYGNAFTEFFKYPDPAFVLNPNVDVTDAVFTEMDKEAIKEVDSCENQQEFLIYEEGICYKGQEFEKDVYLQDDYYTSLD